MGHRHFLWIGVLVALAALALPQRSFAEVRIAMVIGNGAYRHAPRLPNPTNDAADVAASLKRAGFETIVATDLDKAGMDAAAIRFARLARTADVAMFYYSGHAIQFGGINYLAPVDTELRDEADLRRMVRLDEIVADLQQAKNLRILVLDACRDNPLAEELKRSIGTTRALPLQRGLAKIDSPRGMIVAYATQAGRTAEDGPGRNSPYTAAFLNHIEAQEEIGTIFRRITSDVYTATRQAQLPELSLSLIGEYYLRGRVEVSINPNAPAAPPSPPRVSPDAASVREKYRGWTLTPQVGHASTVNDVRMSPDGSKIVSTSQDGTVRIWDVAGGRLLHTLQTYGTFALSRDGRRIATFDVDARVRVRDAANARELYSFAAAPEGEPVKGLNFALSPDGERAVTGTDDFSMKIWNVATGTALRTIATVKGKEFSALSTIAITADGSKIVSVDADKAIRIRGFANGNLLHTLTPHFSETPYLALTADGSRIIAGDKGTFHIWDIVSGALLQTLQIRLNQASKLSPQGPFAISPDGRHIFAAHGIGLIGIWGTSGGPPLRSFSAQTDGKDSITRVRVSPDGKRVVAAYFSNIIRIFDVETSTLLQTFEPVKAYSTAALLSPDDSRIISTVTDESIKIWDARRGLLLRTLRSPAKSVYAVAMSPDGQLILSSHEDQAVRVWDAASGNLQRTLTGHPEPIQALAFSPDGQRVVAMGSYSTVKVWDVRRGDAVGSATIDVPFGLNGTGARMSSDGSRIVSSADGRIFLNDTASGKLLKTMQTADPKNAVWVLAISGDARWIASGHMLKGEIRIWDAASGNLARTLRGNARPTELVFSADGRLLMSDTNDGTIHVWDVASGSMLRTVQKRGTSNRAFAISRDGNRIVSGGAELASYDLAGGGWQWSAIDERPAIVRADGTFWGEPERIGLVRGMESMSLPDDYKAALRRELPLDDGPVAAAK